MNQEKKMISLIAEAMEAEALSRAGAPRAGVRGQRVVHRSYWKAMAMAAGLAGMVCGGLGFASWMRIGDVQPTSTVIATGPGSTRLVIEPGTQLVPPGNNQSHTQGSTPPSTQFVQQMMQSVQSRKSTSAVEHSQLALADPEHSQRCVLVTLYQDGDGQVRCKDVLPHHLTQHRKLQDVSDRELRWLSGASSGGSAGVESGTVVVALAGPESMMPKDDDKAVAMARCVVGGSDSPAQQCVPEGVSVRVKSFAGEY